MTLTKLPAALAKFQAQHHAAGRDGKGNYGTYTTLAGALAAVQPACAHGLSHTQTLQPISDELMVLRTTLMHESGEQVVSELPLPIRQEGGRGNAMQALGSTLTYARRYGLLAIYGIAGDDDDGESAAPAAKQAPAQPPVTAKKTDTPAQASAPAAKTGTQRTKKEVVFLSDEQVSELKAQVKALHPDARSALVAGFKAQFEIPEGVATIADRIQFPEHAAFITNFIQSLPDP